MTSSQNQQNLHFILMQSIAADCIYFRKDKRRECSIIASINFSIGYIINLLVSINLDVEQLNKEILRNFPFHKYRPAIFCLETVNYTDDASSEKRKEIFDIMQSNGYKAFADTYLNTIFISDKLQFFCLEGGKSFFVLLNKSKIISNSSPLYFGEGAGGRSKNSFPA